MIIYCAQSYEIIRDYRDMSEVYKEREKRKRRIGLFEELYNIGQTVDLTKSLIYGIHEVTILPPYMY